MNIKEYLQQHPQWKKRIHGFIMHPVKTRPYWWIRVWQPFYIKKGRGSVIYSSVRKDLPPFHLFQMGKYSVVEDFSCLNNAVGDIVIGDYCRIGLGNTVIGPIRIDNGVNISQNVVLIGLDHNYQDITQGIIEQGITTSPIHIGEHTIIGANVIVLHDLSASTIPQGLWYRHSRRHGGNRIYSRVRFSLSQKNQYFIIMYKLF